MADTMNDLSGELLLWNDCSKYGEKRGKKHSRGKHEHLQRLWTHFY